MNIPNLPSDNLYKFICIGGLILSISSFLSIIYQNQQYANRMFDISYETKLIKEKKDHLINDLNSFEKHVDKMPVSTAQERLKEFKENMRQNELELIKVENSLERLDYFAKDQDSQNKFLKRMFNLGAFCMMIGFILWYTKLQRYLDLIVKRQANQ